MLPSTCDATWANAARQDTPSLAVLPLFDYVDHKHARLGRHYLWFAILRATDSADVPTGHRTTAAHHHSTVGEHLVAGWATPRHYASRKRPHGALPILFGLNDIWRHAERTGRRRSTRLPYAVCTPPPAWHCRQNYRAAFLALRAWTDVTAYPDDTARNNHSPLLRDRISSSFIHPR